MKMKLFATFLLILCLLEQSNGSFFNCSKSASCQKNLDSIQLNMIKDNILSQLDMISPPDASKLPSKRLREEYQRVAEEMEMAETERETETIFLAARDPSGGEDASQLVAAFDVKANLEEKQLLEARLSFFADVEDNKLHEIHVQIYEKNEDGTIGELVLTQSFQVSGKEKIRVNLPVDAVTRWYTTSPISGIFVAALVNGHNVALHPQQTTDDYETMMLQLTMVKSEGRSRRHIAPICTREKPSEGCCLYDLMVDFHAIGWDWIVAPVKYNAYICRGNCHLNQHHYALNENGHTKIMKAAIRFGSNDAADLAHVGGCCHATEYDYVKLIYINRDGHVSVANVNGMIARKCSCS